MADERKSIRPAAQKRSFIRGGCHLSLNPSGERMIRLPPFFAMMLPHFNILDFYQEVDVVGHDDEG